MWELWGKRQLFLFKSHSDFWNGIEQLGMVMHVCSPTWELVAGGSWVRFIFLSYIYYFTYRPTCTIPQCICGSQRRTFRISSLLLPSLFQGSNPYCQACWLVPLLTEPSPWLDLEFDASLGYKVNLRPIWTIYQESVSKAKQNENKRKQIDKTSTKIPSQKQKY